jgi:Protein of unknown function (DUF3830)
LTNNKKDMTGFKIITVGGQEIKFEVYQNEAPITSKAFLEILPFTKIFYHARVSGQEIWINDVPPLDIIQENASVFTEPGEAVLGPLNPARSKTANCFGIYYGEGKGLDACNIFAKVIESDRQKLIDLGNRIWKNGEQKITVSKL